MSRREAWWCNKKCISVWEKRWVVTKSPISTIWCSTATWTSLTTLLASTGTLLEIWPLATLIVKSSWRKIYYWVRSSAPLPLLLTLLRSFPSSRKSNEAFKRKDRRFRRWKEILLLRLNWKNRSGFFTQPSPKAAGVSGSRTTLSIIMLQARRGSARCCRLQNSRGRRRSMTTSTTLWKWRWRRWCLGLLEKGVPVTFLLPRCF